MENINPPNYIHKKYKVYVVEKREYFFFNNLYIYMGYDDGYTESICEIGDLNYIDAEKIYKEISGLYWHVEKYFGRTNRVVVDENTILFLFKKYDYDVYHKNDDKEYIGMLIFIKIYNGFKLVPFRTNTTLENNNLYKLQPGCIKGIINKHFSQTYMYCVDNHLKIREYFDYLILNYGNVNCDLIKLYNDCEVENEINIVKSFGLPSSNNEPIKMKYFINF